MVQVKKGVVGVCVPLNSQGCTGTDPQHCHFLEMNPNRDDSLIRSPNLLSTRSPVIEMTSADMPNIIQGDCKLLKL